MTVKEGYIHKRRAAASDGPIPELQACAGTIQQAYEILKCACSEGGKVLLTGNEGSAADCEHVVGELMKGFMSKRPLPPSVRERILAQGFERASILPIMLEEAFFT